MEKKRLSNCKFSLSKFDWVLYISLAVFCYFSFCHSDIYVTGNRALKLYESNFFDYYDVLHNWTKDYGANYMPSTFWLFALWCLPLKLMGCAAPPYINAGTTRLFYGLWFQLLPIIFFIISAYLIYRIAGQFGFNARRAKICMYSFIAMPIAFFSQFIFSQYDIFTVVCMLAGMYCYWNDRTASFANKSHWLFCFWFGLAVTFKYYAVLIFIVLLFLRTKDIKTIIFSLVIMAIPFAIEYCLYAGSDAFQKSVFGFFALDYIESADFSTRIGSISFMQVACIFMVIWAYFVSPKTKEDEIRWALYLCCGVCFAIFGFTTWHPQWLLFAVPFWVLAASINVNREKFYWGNILFTVALYMFVVQVWEGGVDNNMLTLGIWNKLLGGISFQKNIADLIPLLGTTTLYSAIFAIILAMFVFMHPSYSLKKLSDDDGNDHIGLIRFQLVLAVVLFVVPSFYTLFYALTH